MSDLVIGQLVTPLTAYKAWDGIFAIDNGAYSGFRHDVFERILHRDRDKKEHCLFVAIPDSVGNPIETNELWKKRLTWVDTSWPLAYVAQNGIHEIQIPWDEFTCLFIGGLDPWKESVDVQKLLTRAHKENKHIHIGRVNGYKRFKYFTDLGAHTCDGSGISRFDHMLVTIEEKMGSINKGLTRDEYRLKFYS